MSDNPYQSPHHVTAKTGMGFHVLSPLVSCLGTMTLIVALIHVRPDKGGSIGTYEGPLSFWMPEIVYVGLGMSILGFVVGAITINRPREDDALTPQTRSAVIAMTVSTVNAYASFIVYRVVFAD